MLYDLLLHSTLRRLSFSGSSWATLESPGHLVKNAESLISPQNSDLVKFGVRLGMCILTSQQVILMLVALRTQFGEHSSKGLWNSSSEGLLDQYFSNWQRSLESVPRFDGCEIIEKGSHSVTYGIALKGLLSNWVCLSCLRSHSLL